LKTAWLMDRNSAAGVAASGAVRMTDGAGSGMVGNRAGLNFFFSQPSQTRMNFRSPL